MPLCENISEWKYNAYKIPVIRSGICETQCQTLFLGAPKPLQMVTAVMKLKDAYSLEGKL